MVPTGELEGKVKSARNNESGYQKVESKMSEGGTLCKLKLPTEKISIIIYSFRVINIKGNIM